MYISLSLHRASHLEKRSSLGHSPADAEGQDTALRSPATLLGMAVLSHLLRRCPQKQRQNGNGNLSNSHYYRTKSSPKPALLAPGAGQ